MRQDGQRRVGILRALNEVEVLRMIAFLLGNVARVGHFVYLLIEDFLIELVRIVVHHLKLNIAQLEESIRRARLLLQGIFLENASLAAQLCRSVTCEKLYVFLGLSPRVASVTALVLFFVVIHKQQSSLE